MSVQEYLEPAVKDFANQAKATYSAQLDPQTFMGKQYVAGEDPLQTQAINLAQQGCLLYTSPSPRDRQKSRMPSSA